MYNVQEDLDSCEEELSSHSVQSWNVPSSAGREGVMVRGAFQSKLTVVTPET